MLHVQHADALYAGIGFLVLGVGLVAAYALRAALAARREFRRYAVLSRVRGARPDNQVIPVTSFRPTEPLRRYRPGRE
jgi:hypothetical protein